MLQCSTPRVCMEATASATSPSGTRPVAAWLMGWDVPIVHVIGQGSVHGTLEVSLVSENPYSPVISTIFLSASSRVVFPPVARGHLRMVESSTSPMRALRPEASTGLTPGGS